VITPITRAWVSVTTLTRERREYHDHVSDRSRSRAVIPDHCHVSELHVLWGHWQPILKLALRGPLHNLTSSIAL
jgi:hypothetical protein